MGSRFLALGVDGADPAESSSSVTSSGISRYRLMNYVLRFVRKRSLATNKKDHSVPTLFILVHFHLIPILQPADDAFTVGLATVAILRCRSVSSESQKVGGS